MLTDNVIENGRNAIDGNGVEAQSKDAVKLGSDKDDARLGDSFGKSLVGNSKTGHIDGVGGEETSHAASAVPDLKRSSIRHVGRRLGAVILVVLLKLECYKISWIIPINVPADRQCW